MPTPTLETAQRDEAASRQSATRRGDSDWLSLGAASRFLGISDGTLRRWADEGRVSVFVTPGGHRRFSRRTLHAILPAPRPHRPSLERLGASPERIVRAYRPNARRASTKSQPDPNGRLARLSDGDREEFRVRGRAIVATLLEHLDAAEPDAAATRLRDACQLAADHGRRVAELGASMTEAVEMFLRFRSPFVAELAGIARRRGLDTREATELLVAAESAMDRLLVATMTGHSLVPAAANRHGRGRVGSATAGVAGDGDGTRS